MNNFGLLRLLFAMLVIISHSFELIDGDRAREPLTLIFGTMSVAEVAVAGFFIVSGYLVTQSYEISASSLSFVFKRVLRICPAFFVASLICIMIVGPLAGANLASLSLTDWARLLARAIALQIPRLEDVFVGQPYPSLDGSMWTVAYEFRCYLAVAILGAAGLIRRRAVPPLAVLSWIGTINTAPDWPRIELEGLSGNIHETLRLTTFFLTGASFYLYRDRMMYRTDVAALAAFGLFLSLFSQLTAGAGVAIFGSYLVFWFAFLPNSPRLNAINSTTDISYGVYLYAWPLQMLAVRCVPGITPALLMMITATGASVLALLSWKLVEHPAIALKAAILAKRQSSNILAENAVNSTD